MPDWKQPMQQTYEFYVVDPDTWENKYQLKNVQACSIDRDAESDTLGSGTIEVTDDVGECYVRVYLVTVQNGVTEKHPLATMLVQTPSMDYDGKVQKAVMDAYTPLIELKNNRPPIGYSLFKDDTNIMEMAYRLTRENVRAPVVKTSCEETLKEDFVAETENNWIVFNRDLMAKASYKYALDEMGQIMFSPDKQADYLTPIRTYDDNDDSILYADVSLKHDLYDIPNVVEVVYSNEKGSFYGKAINDDPNSPISTVSRGRVILHRETNPSLDGSPSKETVQLYAEQLLRDKSSVEYTVSYKHGYDGTRLGDCVRINYARAGLMDIKAKIISQSIKCTPGCPVSEKAVFTKKLWR